MLSTIPPPFYEVVLQAGFLNEIFNILQALQVVNTDFTIPTILHTNLAKPGNPQKNAIGLPHCFVAIEIR